jgi:hypothetical protein
MTDPEQTGARTTGPLDAEGNVAPTSHPRTPPTYPSAGLTDDDGDPLSDLPPGSAPELAPAAAEHDGIDPAIADAPTGPRPTGQRVAGQAPADSYPTDQYPGAAPTGPGPTGPGPTRPARPRTTRRASTRSCGRSSGSSSARTAWSSA